MGARKENIGNMILGIKGLSLSWLSASSALNLHMTKGYFET